MNKALTLFDADKMTAFFKEKILPLYPEMESISKVKIKPYKKLIWITTYHVVVSYRVTFVGRDSREEELEVVCSAHSDENRESVFKVLNFLWEEKLNDKSILLPRPLLYSKEYNATFYQAVTGDNLLRYIKADDREMVKDMVKKASHLFAKLHALAAPKDQSIFNLDNTHIQTVIPGRDNILKEVGERFAGLYVKDLDSFYDTFITQEEKFFAKSDERWLIHGDAHPENIIAGPDDKIGLIDFTDFCLADRARDLGSFLQQLGYKIKRNLNDLDFAKEMKHLFLDNYLAESNLELDDSLQDRLDLYFNWTTARTSVFFLLKHEPDPEAGGRMIAEIKENINSKRHAQD